MTHFCVLFSILCCSCEYDSEFDTLSAFPGNLQRKTIDEIDLVEAESVDVENLTTIEPIVPEDTTPKGPSIIEPFPGVKGFPFNRSEADVADGSVVRLDEFLTGIKKSGKRQLKPEDGHLLSTPFSSVGFAVGDFDRDSLPDLFVADQQTGGRLYRNKGDFRFEDVTAIAGIEQANCWGVTPTIVDINNDGLLDIYLCCYNTPNRLFVNRGRRFVEQSDRFGLDFKGASSAASFADYDRDGDLDLYLVTHRLPPINLPDKLPVDREPGKPPRIKEEYREANHLIPYLNGGFVPVESGQYDRIYRNDGSKYLDVTEEVISQSQPYRGNTAIWFDFNDDKWPDIFVANDNKDPNQLLKNLGPDGDGVVRFEDATLDVFDKETWFSKGTSLIDLNGDSRLDLLVAGDVPEQPSQRIIQRGNLFGKDGDSWFLNVARPSQTFSNSAYLSLSRGPFVEIAKSMGIHATGSTSGIACWDLDNDGFEDIWFCNGAVRSFLDNDLNKELRSITDGEKKNRSSVFWSEKSKEAAIDAVYRMTESGTFELVSEQWGVKQSDVSRAVGGADLDLDGDIDVITIDHAGRVVIYKNAIGNENAIQLDLVGHNSNAIGIGALITLTTGEGEFDRVRYISGSGSFLSSQASRVHFGLGVNDSVQTVEIEWPSGNRQTLSGLAANYRYEIREPTTSRSIGKGLRLELNRSMFSEVDVLLRGRAAEELPYEDFDRQPFLPAKHSQLGPGHAWGDIDGDGDDDLFVGGAAFEKPTLYRNEGGFKFNLVETAAFDGDVRCEDLGAVLFDCDSDGDLDLFVVSGGVESKLSSSAMQDRLYINNGSGQFEKSSERLPVYQSSGGPVCVADYNNDGLIDIFVGGRIVPDKFPARPKSVLLKNIGGRFANVTSTVAEEVADVGMVSGCNWIDVDTDGRLDLMLVCQYGATHCFKNVDGKLIDVSKQSGLQNRTGLFNSITPGDIDNDGDTDFVVGNLGTNTTMAADFEKPYGLYSFTTPEDQILVEAHFSGGKAYPLRSLDRFTEVDEQLGKLSESNLQFSKTEIGEIAAKAGWQQTQLDLVNTLESGIWINESDSASVKFRFVALPTIAQSSPIFGVQLADLNGDGDLDLFAVQNFLEVQPTMERFAGGRGVLLMGKGNGQFEMPGIDSGIVVRESGRSATKVDLNADGRCDLVAATNDSGIKFYSNDSTHTPFAIDVRRMSERKNYIGAKVYFRFTDDSIQLHQIVSNSGYLSQSPPIVYSGLNNDKEIESIQITWPDGTSRSGTVENLLRSR